MKDKINKRLLRIETPEDLKNKIAAAMLEINNGNTSNQNAFTTFEFEKLKLSLKKRRVQL